MNNLKYLFIAGMMSVSTVGFSQNIRPASRDIDAEHILYEYSQVLENNLSPKELERISKSSHLRFLDDEQTHLVINSHEDHETSETYVTSLDLKTGNKSVTNVGIIQKNSAHPEQRDENRYGRPN